MKKQRINIEHELRSNSPALIWQFISTPEGLARWIADEVQLDGATFRLTWGNPFQHCETREATVTDMVRQSHLRMRWVDESDDEAYLELRMERSDLTNDYMLIITDYAFAEDVDSLRDIWEDNLHRLRHSTGL